MIVVSHTLTKFRQKNFSLSEVYKPLKIGPFGINSWYINLGLYILWIIDLT